MVIACPQLEDCQVTANITTVRADSTEYHAVQIAATNKAEKSTTKQMLGHFRKVIGDRQVKIVAPKNAKLAADTEKAMMPKVVWGYAVGWDLVEVMREMKADADEVSVYKSANRNDSRIQQS